MKPSGLLEGERPFMIRDCSYLLAMSRYLLRQDDLDYRHPEVKRSLEQARLHGLKNQIESNLQLSNCQGFGKS